MTLSLKSCHPEGSRVCIQGEAGAEPVTQEDSSLLRDCGCWWGVPPRASLPAPFPSCALPHLLRQPGSCSVGAPPAWLKPAGLGAAAPFNPPRSPLSGRAPLPASPPNSPSAMGMAPSPAAPGARPSPFCG